MLIDLHPGSLNLSDLLVFVIWTATGFSLCFVAMDPAAMSAVLASNIVPDGPCLLDGTSIFGGAHQEEFMEREGPPPARHHQSPRGTAPVSPDPEQQSASDTPLKFLMTGKHEAWAM